MPKENIEEPNNVEEEVESPPIRTKKIFVGGLPHNTTDEEFRTYFVQFGEITDAQVMVARDTGRSRGFGFVSFQTEDIVDVIMGQNHEIGGKQVELKRAEPKRPLQAFGTSSRGGGLNFFGLFLSPLIIMCFSYIICKMFLT